MGDIAQRGNRLTFAKGGRAGFQKGRRVGHKRTGNTQRENRLEELGRVDAEKAWTRHGKRDLKLEKHRIRSELKKGGKPWGTGPKPGTIEFVQHHLHKPRKGKAIGSIVKGAKKVIEGGRKIISKIKKKPKTETWKTLDVPGMPGPEKGKYPGIDKAMSNIKKSGDIWGPGKAKGGRAGYAIGSLVHAATKAAKKYHKKKKLAEDTKKGKFPETESLTHQVGPYVGDVGSERPGIKRRGWGKKPGQKKPDREHVPYERHGAKKGGKADKNWIQKAVNPKHKGYCTPMTKKTCTPARKALARTFKKKAKTGWG